VTKTTAAVLVESGKPLELMDLGLPALSPGQALVEIAWSGICHSQLNEARGLRGRDRYLPHCMGHEGAGTVLEVGRGVTKVAAGDRVVLTWLKGAGMDVPASRYDGPAGPVNSGAVATFLEHAVVSENRLVPLAEGIPMREAALLGCAVPTGAGIVLNTLKPSAGQRVAVFGVGGIGLSAVMAASGLGAEVIAVDVVADKLALARTLGAVHAFDASTTEPVEAIRALTGGTGVDFAIEAAGVVAAAEAAFAALRPGGLCIVAGNPPAGKRIAIDPYDLIAGRRLAGSWGGDTRPDDDLPRYAAMYRGGHLPLALLISRVYPLGEVNAALDELEAGTVARAMLQIA